ncbi:MAG: cytochrome P450 [Actinobacteria bacterium]|nr:cytochrome P450 [Actinomycetota bacterium]MDA8963896.1 cytochrome P450 [Acidimicrobiia bacterium]
MNIPELHLPTLDQDFIKDPYSTFEEYRSKTPIFWDEINNLLFVTRHKDVRNIQTSKMFGTTHSHIENFEGDVESSNVPLTYVGYKRSEKYESYDYFWKSEQFSLLNLEGTMHKELRGLVAKAFLPRSVQKLVPFMEKKSKELLSNTNGSNFDLLKDYAQPYSISIIGELLGVPASDHAKFLDWSHKIVKMYDFKVDDVDAMNAENAAKDFFDYAQDLLNRRRIDPQDDMITRLSQVSENDVRLTDHQIICTIILLLNAGHEATVNTLGNGFYGLLSNEKTYEEVSEESSTMTDVVEELIRWDSPLQFFQRYVLEDTEIENFKIPKGSKVAILLGSANRDPAVFENPSELNFNRENKDHSSWGGGIHFCIGAHLARLELEVSFEHLLKKNLLLKTEPERTGAFGIRGYENLLVTT